MYPYNLKLMVKSSDIGTPVNGIKPDNRRKGK